MLSDWCAKLRQNRLFNGSDVAFMPRLANYPGVTVDKRGRLPRRRGRPHYRPAGTYTGTARRSGGERWVTVGKMWAFQSDAIIAAADATSPA